ncbi:L-2-amino-thiazoline-4-carboxylic acid hydrolase [Candidatus Poribacteria bacterium]|nr:L-2-amino-thiazoline-4-carboxylic acid hydrolase [Candidatus Poribacteria bacterium]
MSKENEMDELEREQREGMDWETLGKAMSERQEAGTTYITPLAGLFGQFFAITTKILIEKFGPAEGEALIKEVVERFAEERGRRIAGKVRALGKPLTLKNFFVHNDLDSAGVTSDVVADIEDGDLLLNISSCNICRGSQEWGLREYAHRYCRYVDVAILRAYNPEIKLQVSKTLTGGDEACCFRYSVRK